MIGDAIDRVDGRLKVTGGARYAAEWPIDQLALRRDRAEHDRARDDHRHRYDRRDARSRACWRPDRRQRAAAAGRGTRGLQASGRTRPVAAAEPRGPLQRRADRGRRRRHVRAGDARGVAGRGHLSRGARLRSTCTRSCRRRSRTRRRSSGSSTQPAVAAMSRRGLSQADAVVDADLYARRSRPTMRWSRTRRSPSGDDDQLTLYDSTQYVYGVKRFVAKTFGIPDEHVRVVSKFVGGAFGSKGSAWSHVVLAAMAAQARVKRPVKLVAHPAADVRTRGRAAVHRPAPRRSAGATTGIDRDHAGRGLEHVDVRGLGRVVDASDARCCTRARTSTPSQRLVG